MIVGVSLSVPSLPNDYVVYLDGELLWEYTPGAFEHGGVVHWISLPGTELAGHVLTVSAPPPQN